MQKNMYHQQVREALKAYSDNNITNEQLKIAIESTSDTINHLEATEVGGIVLIGYRLMLQSLENMRDSRARFRVVS